MSDKRSIQDIIPPARSKPIRPSITPPVPENHVSTPPPPESYTMPPMSNERPPRKGLLIAGIGIGALLVVGIVIALMSTVFHSATATVVLSEYRSDVSGSYDAGGTSALAYQTVSVSDVATKSVPATGTQKADDHAFGTIVITNTSTKTQRLITNTRFQSTAGLVYRIHTPVVVPAATTKSGATTPGTAEVLVYADEAGEKYNVATADFTVPGLKGSPTFTQVTAKSKGGITGGFVGDKAVVEKTVRNQAIAELKAALERSLRDKVTAATPANTVVFADSVELSYTEDPDKADGGNATLSVKGSALAPAFSGDQLARALASRAQISTDAPLTLASPAELTYSAGGGNVESGGAIAFTLSGTAHLVAAFNPTQLATDLAGKTEVAAQSVRAQYPALVGPMKLTVRPFWLHTLPTNPDHIKVDVKGALDQTP